MKELPTSKKLIIYINKYLLSAKDYDHILE